MVLTKAVTLALECIDKELRKVAFDANLFDKGLADYLGAKKASERRRELLHARSRLKELINEQMVMEVKS